MVFSIRDTCIIDTQADYIDLVGTNAIKVPVGTTAQRPSCSNPFFDDAGQLRYNTDNNSFEVETLSGLGSSWHCISWCTPKRSIWAWGFNNTGRIGDGTLTNRCSPVREICSATDWCQVDMGFGGSAIKTTGQLWGWGSNNCGQLGDGTLTNRCSPVRERCSATDWCQVCRGGYNTAAVKTSGQLWVWGANGCGQLGDGTVTLRCSPVREISSSTNWCQVSTSTGVVNFTAAIKTSGQLWTWGANTPYGRLADGTNTNRCSPVREFCSATDWCQVSIGSTHGAAVKTNGQIWTWGRGTDGAGGTGTTANTCSPVREFCSATDWCGVSMVGALTTEAIKTSGQIWGWGRNSCGTLGDGTLTNRCSPVREFCSATDWCGVSSGSLRHTAAIKTTGQIWAWGQNTCGQVGDGTTVQRCSPVREISSATDWCSVSAGSFVTAAIKIT
jgi:alpha-tubulin suppressor-like RCC1 family protein